MKVSIQVSRFTWPGGDAEIGPTFARLVRGVEDAGFDTLWVMDHFFQLDPMLGSADEPMLEGHTALSVAAGMTQRVRLGALVAGVIYRHPSLLVKTVTTLDVLSGGRAWLGVGAAWYQRECEGLGFEFPRPAARFEMLEEALRIAHQTWQGDRSPIHGKHFRLEEPVVSPAPVTRPRPPILIGGGGERKTLRLVARYAEACNLFAQSGEEVLRHKLDVLERHCADAGRDPGTVEKTVTVPVNFDKASSQEVIDRCAGLSRLGFDHAIFNVARDYTVEPLARVGTEIIPALAAL
ncbi:MAG TPA: LLM class F420-dependent oxidoreductase [Actinomycetota bacterium]